MSYIPQFDAHESTHTKLQESRHIPTLTCLASITRLPTFEEAASGFPNKRKGKFYSLISSWLAPTVNLETLPFTYSVCFFWEELADKLYHP